MSEITGAHFSDCISNACFQQQLFVILDSVILLLIHMQETIVIALQSSMLSCVLTFESHGPELLRSKTTCSSPTERKGQYNSYCSRDKRSRCPPFPPSGFIYLCCKIQCIYLSPFCFTRIDVSVVVTELFTTHTYLPKT